ncbi:MAG: hypothetical protein HEQ23_09130 [Tepidisphaera sp.]
MPNTNSEKSEVGNLANVVLRIDSIRSITQPKGTYSVIAAPDEPPYRASSSVPKFDVVHLDKTTLGIRAVFEFQGEKEVVGEGGDRAHVPFFSATAEYLVIYVLLEGADLQPADLHAFAKLNTRLNLHPFWREFVHDSLSRAGMPQFLLPPYNPFKAAKEREQQKQSSSSST